MAYTYMIERKLMNWNDWNNIKLGINVLEDPQTKWFIDKQMCNIVFFKV